MRLCLVILASLVFTPLVKGYAQEQAFFKKANHFFQQYVTEEGAVRYKKLHSNPAPLAALTKQIADPAFSSLKGKTLKAFYLNAYNLLTIQQVVDHYPIHSPKAVEGFFDGIKHKVAGRRITLNQLEKKTLFKQFPDPRLHFALVCAASGCPPLKNKAYQPRKLDKQLARQTQRALMDTAFIKVNPDQRLARISKIFKWYKKDFLKQAPSLLAYINKHRSKQLPADTRLRYYSYDWRLNTMEATH